jgi:ribose 5-phosphate isomerase A
MDQGTMKENAGKAAVDAMVKDGMKIGLGTGSTAITATRYIGVLRERGELKNIRAVATSFQTELECEKWEIPLYSLNSRCIDGRLDLTIDGADQFDRKAFCVKGGGGALLMEKIIAYSSAAYAIVADETKTTEALGITFPVPLEVIPESRVFVCREVEKLGAKGVIREAVRKAGPVITEHGNIILDICFREPVFPSAMEEILNHIPGVVENGFFTKLHPRIFIAKADGSVETRD